MDSQLLNERIQNSDGFQDLEAPIRTKVSAILQSIGTLRTVEAGRPLIQAGHLGFSGGFLLLDGTATVRTAGGRDVEIVAPALLGEMAQFHTTDRRTATVNAVSGVTLLEFDWDDFYTRTESELGADGTAQVRAAVEGTVWQRFNHPELLALPLFRGLPAPLMQKVCMPFAWLTERKAYRDGERLIGKGERCQQAGILLTRGTVTLKIDANREWQITSPHLIGVMPKNDPSLLWTADATANGEAVTYQFNWTIYLEQIQKRLTPTEQQQMIEAMKTNGKEHLWH